MTPPQPRAHPATPESVMTRRHVPGCVPAFHQETCMDCGGCVGSCPHDAIDLFKGFITIRASCTECDLCVRVCPVDALESVKTA